MPLPECAVLVQTLAKLGEEKAVSFEYQSCLSVRHDFIPRGTRALLDDLDVSRLEQKGSVVVPLRQANHVSEIDRVEEFVNRCTQLEKTNLIVCQAGKLLENRAGLHIVAESDFSEVCCSSLNDSGLHFLIAPGTEFRIDCRDARTGNSDRDQLFQCTGRERDSSVLH